MTGAEFRPLCGDDHQAAGAAAPGQHVGAQRNRIEEMTSGTRVGRQPFDDPSKLGKRQSSTAQSFVCHWSAGRSNVLGSVTGSC